MSGELADPDIELSNEEISDAVLSALASSPTVSGWTPPTLSVSNEGYSASPALDLVVHRKGGQMLRTGLSRVEVAVVLLIVLVLTGLTLSGIVRVREAAALSSCRNNLRQVAVGAHDYYDTNGRLPPLIDLGEGAPTGGGLPSVFGTLMPYVEAGPAHFNPKRSSPGDYHAHSSIVFTYDNKGSPLIENGGLANRTWRPFIDPGDATGDRLRDVPMTLPDGTMGYYATGSYAANGLIPWRVGLFPQSFPHGPANTIMFAERPQVCRTDSGEVVYNLWGLGFYSPHMPAFATLTPAEPPGLFATGQVAPASPLPDESAPDRDAHILVRVGRWDAPPQPPDFRTPMQMMHWSHQCDPRLPASPHIAGMQVAMADGSVRVLAPDTTPWVFWAACMPGER